MHLKEFGSRPCISYTTYKPCLSPVQIQEKTCVHVYSSCLLPDLPHLVDKEDGYDHQNDDNHCPAHCSCNYCTPSLSCKDTEEERLASSNLKCHLKYCKSCCTHLLALLALTFPPPSAVRSQSPQQLPQTVLLPPPPPNWTCQETEHSPQSSTPCSRQCPGREGAAKRHSWLLR